MCKESFKIVFAFHESGVTTLFALERLYQLCNASKTVRSTSWDLLVNSVESCCIYIVKCNASYIFL